MQVELIRYCNLFCLYSRLLLRSEGFNAISPTERKSRQWCQTVSMVTGETMSVDTSRWSLLANFVGHSIGRYPVSIAGITKVLC